MIAAFGRSQHREAASEWRRLFDVNLFGHIAMTQALLPALIESRGTGQTTICTCCPVSNFTIIGDIDRRQFELG